MNTSLCLCRCHGPHLAHSLLFLPRARCSRLCTAERLWGGRQLVGRAGEILRRRRPPYPSTAESWFIDHPRRGVPVRESPALPIRRNLTRSSIARLSIPDHGGCLINLESWWTASTIMLIIAIRGIAHGPLCWCPLVWRPALPAVCKIRPDFRAPFEVAS